MESWCPCSLSAKEKSPSGVRARCFHHISEILIKTQSNVTHWNGHVISGSFSGSGGGQSPTSACMWCCPRKNKSGFIEKFGVRCAREKALGLFGRCKRGLLIFWWLGRPDFFKAGPILPCPSQNTCRNIGFCVISVCISSSSSSSSFRNYVARNANLARLVAPVIMGYNAHTHALPVTHRS